MSDLEDLAEIAEQSAFGFRGLDNHGAPRRPASETCGAGHAWTETSARWHKDRRGRFRRVCRICDKNRAALRRVCDRIAGRMPTASETT